MQIPYKRVVEGTVESVNTRFYLRIGDTKVTSVEAVIPEKLVGKRIRVTVEQLPDEPSDS